jgi:hypothetical protein
MTKSIPINYDEYPATGGHSGRKVTIHINLTGCSQIVNNDPDGMPGMLRSLQKETILMKSFHFLKTQFTFCLTYTTLQRYTKIYHNIPK